MLSGGLGNQMFQYAFGRALSIENNTKFLLDFSSIINHKDNTTREYELKIFQIDITIATKWKSLKYQYPSILNRINIKLNKLCGIPKIFKSNVMTERNYSKNKKLLKNTLIRGYWQSEKYFNIIESTIRKEFTFPKNLDKKNSLLEKRIEGTNSISIHVRRGDYADNPLTNKRHGLCSLDYYTNSIRYISNHINNPVFYIFSDDPEWVKNNIIIDYSSEIINWNLGRESYIDMYLMSICKHNIIANSSFSWWGAWLNSNPQKIVIAPKKWFANEGISTRTNDLIPKAWMQI